MPGVSLEEIQEEFADLDIDITDGDILSKLKEYCDLYNVDANKISCEYFSFNTKNKAGTAPTLENLAQFETEKLKHLRGPRRPLDPIEGVENLPDCADVGTPTRLTAVAKRMITPDNPVNKRFVTAMGSPALNSSMNPIEPGSQSCKYADRKNRGEVVLKHNLDLTGDWTPSPKPCHVKVDETRLTSTYKYMFESLRGRAAVLDETICKLGDLLIEEHKLGEPMDIRLTEVEPQVAIGRICCDSEGHLNSNSVVLQCSLDSSGGHALPLDLSNLESFSFFPGQIVGVECTNPNGSKLLVNKVYNDVPARRPKSIEEDCVTQVVVASGPYTTSDSLNNQPLQDILAYIQEHQPQVAILIGPFVDVRNNALVDATQAYQQIFNDMLKAIFAVVEELKTQVVLVPAQRDAHENCVYPQPPYNIGNQNLWSNKIISISDPGELVINGTRVGISSSDILFHLGKEEMCFPPRSGDRLSRLASHLVAQRSFYPVYPPNMEQNIDHEHQELFGLMETCPDLLLLPSDLVYFARELDTCTVINPGRLTKGSGPGTFASLLLKSENGKLAFKAEVIRI